MSRSMYVSARRVNAAEPHIRTGQHIQYDREYNRKCITEFDNKPVAKA
jgi:hypothetical protein